MTPSRFLALILACGGLASTGRPAAIANFGAIEQYFFDTYGIDSGLPGVSVNTVCQTRDGFLWVATGGGLARFDGVRFVSFRPRDTPALQTALIYSLCEAKDGSLWIGTAAGLLRRRGDRFERIGLPEEGVYTLAEGSEGRIWIGTHERGLFVWENGRLRPVADPALGGARFIIRVFVADDGRIWVATNHGVVRLTAGGRVDGLESPSGIGAAVVALCEQPAGTMWLGTRGGGLYRWSAGKTTRFGLAEGLDGPDVSDLHASKDGGIWIVSRRLQRLADPRKPAIVTVPGVPRDGIYSAYEDREGSVWLCAKERGLIRGEGMPYRLISARDGLPDAGVRSITQDRDGTLWVASPARGLVKIAPDGNMVFDSPATARPAPRPSVVLAARDGALWMGSAGPLVVRRQGLDTAMPEVQGVYGLFEDSTGSIWIGAVEAGIFRYRDGHLTPIPLARGGIVPHASSFCEAPDGSIYATTWSSGLARIRNDVATLYTRAEGLPTDEVRAVYADSENRVWLGFRGRGLGLWENGVCWSPEALAQMFFDHVTAIAEDRHGRLWLGTPAGVMWVAKSELLAAQRGEKPATEIRVAQVNRTLRAAAVWSGSQTVVCSTRDRKLLFATRDGILAIDPEHVLSGRTPPPSYIDRVTVDGHTSDPAQGVTLAAGAKNLVLDYTAPSFVEPNQVFFKYRLEGYDGDWIDAKARRTAVYNSLAPGRYTFRLTACNADGAWNPQERTFAIVQLPHFYQTTWFMAAIAACLVGAIVGLNRWSHHQLQVRLERLEAKQATEKERRRIAKHLHDDLGGDLTEIGLLAETIQHQMSSPQLSADATALSERVRTLAGTLDAIVWSANPANDSLDRLSTFVCSLFQDLCRMAGIRCRIDLPVALPALPLTPDERSNLFLAAREAMTNLAKHASATEAWLHLKMVGTVFQLVLEDNGRGFDLRASEVGDRNGLANIRSRIAELKGTVAFDSVIGRGTTVVIHVPLKA